MTFLIENTDTGLMAAEDCTGEHDGRFTDDARKAIAFDTRGEASDFCQNFGPNWRVVEYYPEQAMTELPIVSLLRRGHAQPCECVECEAAALIREMEAVLLNIRTIADDMGGKTPAQRCSWIVDECDAALAKAREA